MIMVHIAIVDDSRPIRENLTQIFDLFEDIQVVFAADDGDAVLAHMALAEPKPSLILMDIEMRKTDGITATRMVKDNYPDTKVVMLSVLDQDKKIVEALAAGADGYLLKDEKPMKMVQAIKDAVEGRLSMSPLVAHKTLNHIRQQNDTSQLKQPHDFQLTGRELEILNHLAQGKTSTAISEELFISSSTVRRHIESLYKKLAVHSKIEAVQLARNNRWLK